MIDVAVDAKVFRQFLWFGLVGVAGFFIDVAALYAAMAVFGAGPYSGRVFSYLVAATGTWALNRRYTFPDQRRADRWHEWSRFLAANAVGGAVNYSVYAVLIATSGTVAALPVLGVAAGSLAGLAVNFTLSRLIVFNEGGTRV